MSKIIGIDLGTTNSCVAVIEGGEPVIIPNPEGGRTTPSVVAFKDGEKLVGTLAKRQAVSMPDRTVRSIKRKMGQNYRVKIGDKEYSPQEISAMILRKLKEDAEAYLGEKIEKAVNLPPELACELLRDEVEAAKNKKRLSSRVVKISLLMGMKAYLFWNRYYGLTIPREPEPELEYSESYQPCLAHELASSF